MSYTRRPPLQRTSRMRLTLWLGGLASAAILACGPRYDPGNGPPGTLELTVRDGDGAVVPALVTLRNLDGTARPIFSTSQSLSRVAPHVFGMVDSAALLA